MTDEITYLPNEPNLCIPRISTNLDRKFVFNIIKDLKLGEIDRIDLVKKQGDRGENFQRCFIHMKKWFHNENALRARERLIQGKDIKVFYDHPWFWRILAKRKKEKSSEEEINEETNLNI